jgi:hypothetical protein
VTESFFHVFESETRLYVSDVTVTVQIFFFFFASLLRFEFWQMSVLQFWKIFI